MATGGNLEHLTSEKAVRQAMALFQKIGRDAFIAEYSVPEKKFGRSRDWFVVEDGLGYDSKPLSAAAYGFQHGREKALHADDFHGGDPVKKQMGLLGFRVAKWLSPELEKGEVYTRKDLKGLFGIADATINNGVFQPKGTNSIWLFVTRDKTADRTQYNDVFAGDLLYWQGQSKGRTDNLIVNHEESGNELLVFYRESKSQYAGAGFRFEGQFRYASHSGSLPKNFVLQRWSENADGILEEEEDFDPHSVEDGRKKIWAKIRRRQGQPAFRRKLLRAYGGRCAVTGCSVQNLLEAAHIRPYLGAQTNVTHNGLLLRADIHTLFDCGLLSVSLDGLVLLADELENTEYSKLAGKKIILPEAKKDRPHSKALRWHLETHGF